MSAAGFERVRASCSEFDAEPGQVLALAGDSGAGMFVILEGEAVVELRAATYELGPGAFFGELALLVPGATRVARVGQRARSAASLFLARSSSRCSTRSRP